MNICKYLISNTKQCLLILSLLLFSSFNIKADNKTNSGLHFNSYEAPKENRTSLHVPTSKISGLDKGFSIKFDCRIRDRRYYFGYIFRMINKKNENIDMLFMDVAQAEMGTLKAADNLILQFKRSEVPDFQPNNQWNTIEFSLIDGQISLTIDGIRKTAPAPYKKFSDFDIFFGVNNEDIYFTSDIPSMVIRNLRLYNHKGKEIRYWSMDTHAEDIIYDEYSHEKAFVKNPEWEIDQHYKWSCKATFCSGNFPQIAFDHLNEKLYVARDNKIMIYDVFKDRLDSITGTKGDVYNTYPNQLIFDTNHNQLVSYEFTTDTLNYFDWREKVWDSFDNKLRKVNFWHHSRCFIPEDSLLVIFGGYGHHRYKGMMMKYSFADKRWNNVDISSKICPRYLGSIGYLGDGKLLYYGGYGNKSGNQEEYTNNFYDLYQIDVRTDSVTHLWTKDLTQGEQHYTGSNSMVIDKDNNCFYVLSYENKKHKTHIHIKEFSIDKSEYRIVGDSIPYLFTDNRSYCDFFLCPGSNKLLAVTSHTRQEQNVSDVNIYTINYRPLSAKDVYQSPKESRAVIYIILVILLSLAVAAFIYYWFVWRKKKQVSTSDDLLTEQSMFEGEDEAVNLEELENTPVVLRPSSIILLGGFQVIDSHGKDITKKFSPTVKSLFLIILLYTMKSGKGITSLALRDLLWFDKDDGSARNNRNVNLSKLRPLLLSVGNVEVNDDNNYWCVTMDKNVFCDYQTIMALCTKIKTEQGFNRAYVLELLRLTFKGVLLPNVHAEWVDSFKADFSSMLIDLLLEISRLPMVQTDYELLYKIGDVILLHDNIDEDGIRLKCLGLYNLNRKGKALQSFNKFCEGYKSLLWEDYKGTFNDLIK